MRLRWVRDLALGGFSANASGFATFLGLLVLFDGPRELWNHLAQVTAVGSALVAMGTIGGGVAGLVAAEIRAIAGERWWFALPVGFPLGAVVGGIEMIATTWVLDGTRPLAVVLAGAAAGGTVLGFGLPLYLVLDVTGKPGWAAVAATPVLACLALLGGLGLLTLVGT